MAGGYLCPNSVSGYLRNGNITRIGKHLNSLIIHSKYKTHYNNCWSIPLKTWVYILSTPTNVTQDGVRLHATSYLSVFVFWRSFNISEFFSSWCLIIIFECGITNCRFEAVYGLYADLSFGVVIEFNFSLRSGVLVKYLLAFFKKSLHSIVDW